MLRVKTGVFAVDFIEQSELESFLDRISFFHDVEWQAYTSLPGSKLNGGRPNTFIAEDEDVYTTVSPYHTKGMIWGSVKDLEKRTLMSNIRC